MKNFMFKGLILSVIAIFFFAGIVISCDDDGSKPITPTLQLPIAIQNTYWINDNNKYIDFYTNSVIISSNEYTIQNIVKINDTTTQLQFSNTADKAITYTTDNSNKITITGVTFLDILQI